MADQVAVNLPKLSLAMAEGTLTQWLVDDGAMVTEGDPIYLVETDKVETEVEAPASGRLQRLGTAGETYQVGQQLATIDAV